MKRRAPLARRDAVQIETIGVHSKSLYSAFLGYPKPILHVPCSLCFKSDYSSYPQCLGRISLVVFMWCGSKHIEI